MGFVHVRNCEESVGAPQYLFTNYLLNFSLQPFSQNYNLASLITHIGWGNFIYEWWGLQFSNDFERLLSEFLFW